MKTILLKNGYKTLQRVKITFKVKDCRRVVLKVEGHFFYLIKNKINKINKNILN